MTDCTIVAGGVALFQQWDAQLMALYLESFTTGAYEGHYLDVADERQWLFQLFSRHAASCIVAYRAERLAGFLISADSGYDRLLPSDFGVAVGAVPARSIAELAVDPAFRSRGLGTRLVQRSLADTMGSYGSLIVRSHGAASAAHRLYLRLGFEAVGTVRSPNPMIHGGRRYMAVTEKRYFAHRFA